MRLWIVLLILILMLGCDPSGNQKLMCSNSLNACKKILTEYSKHTREKAYSKCVEDATKHVCNCRCDGQLDTEEILNTLRGWPQKKESQDETLEEGR